MAKPIKIDIKTHPMFRYKIGTHVNNNIVSCLECRFQHANTFLGCQEAATIHVKQGHWSDKE